MPILKTKEYEVPIELTDVLHLVVPAEFASPVIIKSHHKSSTRFKVKYWHTEDRTHRCQTFKDLVDAEQFKEQKVWAEEMLLRNVTVAEFLADQKYFQAYYRLHPQAVEYDAQDVPLPPRMLGIWLGDGDSTCCAITTADTEIVDYITEVATSFGLYVKPDGIHYRITKAKPGEASALSPGRLVDRAQLDKALQAMADGASCWQAGRQYQIDGNAVRRYKALADAGELDDYFEARAQNPITLALKDLGVWGNKHIPKCYIENSRQARLELLAGLIDTDGYASKTYYDFCFKSERLLADVVTLARSLGFVARDPQYTPKTCVNAAEGPKVCEAYRSFVRGGDNLLEIPVLLARKKLQAKTKRYDQVPFEIMADQV